MGRDDKKPLGARVDSMANSMSEIVLEISDRVRVLMALGLDGVNLVFTMAVQLAASCHQAPPLTVGLDAPNSSHTWTPSELSQRFGAIVGR